MWNYNIGYHLRPKHLPYPPKRCRGHMGWLSFLLFLLHTKFPFNERKEGRKKLIQKINCRLLLYCEEKQDIQRQKSEWNAIANFQEMCVNGGAWRNGVEPGDGGCFCPQGGRTGAMTCREMDQALWTWFCDLQKALGCRADWPGSGSSPSFISELHPWFLCVAGDQHPKHPTLTLCLS